MNEKESKRQRGIAKRRDLLRLRLDDIHHSFNMFSTQRYFALLCENIVF